MLHDQLILPFHFPDERQFDTFYSGRNAQAVARLKEVALDTERQFLYLFGAASSGCTHLLQACCQATSQGRQAAYLDCAELSVFSPSILSGFETYDVIALDHIEVIMHEPAWEEQLFHFYNQALAGKANLLVAAKSPPAQLSCQLPDLQSRLSAGLSFYIHPLSDEDKTKVLIMRAHARGMHLDEKTAGYLLTHYARDLSALMALLDRLDQNSLVAQRRLTIPFVKSVLSL
jgi:DnaA family protein